MTFDSVKKTNKTLEKTSIIFGYVMDSFFLPSFAFFMLPMLSVFFSNTGNEYVPYLLFGIGYLARPFGGYLFGYLGDKYGARTSLVFSLLLSSVATLMIAFLPDSEGGMVVAQAGIFLLRFLQGVGSGNTISLLAVYYKKNKAYKSGFIAGMTLSLGISGFLLAKVLSVYGVSNYGFGWRAPFLIAGILGLFAVFLRYKYIEQPTGVSSFFELKIKNLFIDYKKSSYLTILITGMFLMPLYISIFSLNKFVRTDHVEGFLFENIIVNLLVMMAAFLFFGYNFEKMKIGSYKKQIIWAHVLLPFFFLIKDFLHSPVYTYAVQIVFLSINALFLLYYFSYIPELFPKSIRYRAVGLNYAIGYAAIGGTCMVAFQYLDSLSNDCNFSAFLIAGVALLILKAEQKVKTYRE